MKIDKVTCHVLSASVEEPIHFGIGAFPTFSAIVVEIEIDDGTTGIGECISRRTPQVVKTIVEDLLTPVIRGKDPLDIEGLWEAMFDQLRRWGHSRGFMVEAISGVDIALWDIFSKTLGVPLYKALTGHGRDRVRCYASSVYFNDLDWMQKEAQQQIDAGHTAIKVKIGRSRELGGPRMDVASVKAIREAVGPDVELMLDVNGAYHAATAVRVGRELEQYDISWIEEPVPPDDVAGYAHIRRMLKIPIAGGETEFTVYGFRDLIEQRGIDILQPDIARAGGVTGCRRIATLANAYHLQVAPHTGFSGGVSQLAALQFAAATPNFLTYEYMYIHNPLREIFTEPFPKAEDGYIEVPQRPGLGLELDGDALDRYALR
ncbi:MAG: mandelate racemase/muconate lactonizing enzyme family protein [Candidatus Bipolaricaulia bacterium]